MKRILLIAILISTANVYACSCIGKNTIKQELKVSDITVVATVIESKLVRIWSDTTVARDLYDLAVENDRTDSSETYKDWKNNSHMFSLQLVDYSIVVEENLKGKIRSDTIVVRTGMGNGDCGFTFEIGKQYLIYAKKEHKVKYTQEKLGRKKKELLNVYRTDICSRTKVASEATEELLKIKKN